MSIDQKIKWTKGWRDYPEAYMKLKTPSVTGIIKDMVPDPDFDKFVEEVGKERADQIMKDAGDRGTAMHQYIELFVTNYMTSKDASYSIEKAIREGKELLVKESIPSAKIEEGCKYFYNYYESGHFSNISKLIGVEIPIYSPSLFFRGKGDLAYINTLSNYVSTDYKTSSALISSGSVKETKYKLQIGGYSIAFEEMYAAQGKHISFADGEIVCVVTKTGNVQTINISGDEMYHYKQEFKKLAKQWHLNNNQSFLF